MSATAPLYPSARVDVTTYNNFLKKEVDMTIRKNPILAAMQEKGRITLNWAKQGGPEVVWDVRYRSMDPEVGEDMTPIGMPRDNLWKQCKLQWRRYFKGQSISKFEKLINGGSNSIVKIVDKLYPTQVKSIMDRLAKDFFNNDGNSATSDYNKRIHGIPSWMGGTGSIIADDAGTGLVEDPTDTYAGLRTDVNYYGGSWTPSTGAEWPDGSGDYEYQFFSPMKLDISAATLNIEASTHSWYYQWQQAFNFVNTYLFAQHGLKWDVFVVSPNAMRQMKDSLTGDTSLFVQRGPAESLLVKLGFAPISYENVDVITDHNINASTKYGYGLIYDKLELRSLQPQLIQKEDDRDITVSADVTVADCWCNMAIESPAFSCEFEDLA